MHCIIATLVVRAFPNTEATLITVYNGIFPKMSLHCDIGEIIRVRLGIAAYNILAYVESSMGKSLPPSSELNGSGTQENIAIRRSERKCNTDSHHVLK